MKIHQTIATALVGAASLLGVGASQAQITVSANPWYNNITVGAPLTQGVYGQIVLGNATVPPPVYSSRPVIIHRTAGRYDPMYLYVPPGHRKKWDKHCSRYNACSRPVYFVNVASPRAYAIHRPGERVMVREPVVVHRPVVVVDRDDRHDDKRERKEVRRYQKEYEKARRDDDRRHKGWERGNQGQGKQIGWDRGRGNPHRD